MGKKKRETVVGISYELMELPSGNNVLKSKKEDAEADFMEPSTSKKSTERLSVRRTQEGSITTAEGIEAEDETSTARKNILYGKLIEKYFYQTLQAERHLKHFYAIYDYFLQTCHFSKCNILRTVKS